MDVSMGWFYWTVLLVSLLGMFAGWLFRHNPYDLFWGLLCGFIVSLIVAFKGLVQYVYPDLFFTFQSDTKGITQTKETVILSLTIPEMGKKQIRGLALDEWQTLAHGVIERGYRYTVRDLQDIFGNQATGNSIYGRATQQLVDAGVLVQAGANGVAVTDHVGRHFFSQLDKRDYKVLNLFPTPPTNESV